jgi:hypothetical protein
MTITHYISQAKMDGVNKAVVEVVIQQFTELVADVPEDQRAIVQEQVDKRVALLKEQFSTKKKGKKVAASGNGAKRAPSAYNLFMAEKMKELAGSEPSSSKSDLMKKIAVLWREQKSKNAGSA